MLTTRDVPWKLALTALQCEGWDAHEAHEGVCNYCHQNALVKFTEDPFCDELAVWDQTQADRLDGAAENAKDDWCWTCWKTRKDDV